MANAQKVCRILRRMLIHSSRVSTLKSLDIAQLTCLYEKISSRLVCPAGERILSPLTVSDGNTAKSPY